MFSSPMFFSLSERKIIISATFILLSANAFNLDQCNILSFGKELNMSQKLTFVLGTTKNIVGKGENAG